MSTLTQRSLSSGEISPRLYARCDTVKYATGVRTMRNTVVLKDGGSANRAGSTYVAEGKNPSAAVRLVPFVAGSTAYVLEFGNLYMRVHQNGRPVRQSTKVITAITKANPAVVTSVAHGYSNGDHVYLTGIVGMTELNGRTFKIANIAANTFELQSLDGVNINSTSYTAYSSAGTAARVYTLTTTFTTANVANLKVAFEGSSSLLIACIGLGIFKLSTGGSTSWTLTLQVFTTGTMTAPSIGTVGSVGAAVQSYVVTSVNDETGEESLPSNVASPLYLKASVANPVVVSWAATSGATSYNVYKAYANGVYGLIGLCGPLGSPSFSDEGQDVDFASSYPRLRSYSGTWFCCAYFQRRLFLGGNILKPGKFIGCMTGVATNLLYSTPILATDSLEATLDGGPRGQLIYSMLDLKNLVIFTSEGEWIIEGDTNGVIKPDAINPKEHSSFGSAALTPLKVGSSAVFLQACGNQVLDLGFDMNQDGYKGNDLTAFASHLLEIETITDWAYQKRPHSIVWAVRSDGTLLGLTYVKEQEIVAWHRHDTDGTYESVCCVREGTEDVLYAVVKRTINGFTKRMIERFSTRAFTDILDLNLVDASLSYDGRNTGSTTMTLSGGSTWAYDETITCTASAASFTSADVGNEVHFTAADGSIVRFTIVAYSSTTVVTGRPDRTVPADLRALATTDWALAVDSVSGLWHLEGKAVSVLADGFVIASPNNAAYATLTVTAGAIALDNCYSVIRVGLPYTSDLEMLDIDTPQSETLADKNMLVTSVLFHVEKTRGLWVGGAAPSDDDVDPLEGLTEAKTRSSEALDEPITLETEKIEINIEGTWNSNGRVFIRQVDPLPVSILAVKPSGLFPIKGGTRGG